MSHDMYEVWAREKEEFGKGVAQGAAEERKAVIDSLTKRYAKARVLATRNPEMWLFVGDELHAAITEFERGDHLKKEQP